METCLLRFYELKLFCITFCQYKSRDGYNTLYTVRTLRMEHCILNTTSYNIWSMFYININAVVSKK